MSEELHKLLPVLGLESLPPHLLEAFTHRSYASERRLDYDNQRLEFLGDAVLEIIVSDWLYRRYPEYREGELTKLRAILACEETLASFARHLEFGRFLRMGVGEIEAKGDERPSTLADLFEACLGALYLDLGFDWVKIWITGLLEREAPDPEVFRRGMNSKGTLQELSQERWGTVPNYRVLQVAGPAHNPVYTVQVEVRDHVASASGSGRKNAEMNAASALLAILKQEDNHD